MEDQSQVEEVVSVCGRLKRWLVLHHQTRGNLRPSLAGSLAVQVGRVAACSVGKYSLIFPRFLQEIELRKDNIYLWISEPIFLLTVDTSFLTLSQSRACIVGVGVGGVCRPLVLPHPHARHSELPWAGRGRILLEMLIVGRLLLLVLRIGVGFTISSSLQYTAPAAVFAVASKW